MAFLFTHIWAANLVLKKLKKRQFISRFENIDDYLFGAIAPDIRYINNSPREITHKPYGENSLFKALKASSTSMPFIAGYETHLIVDAAWSNEKKWLKESIYEYYKVNPNVPVQKFALYALVDDYFQAEADWVFPLVCAGNVLRANDAGILLKFGFSEKDILAYKLAASVYLREPGFDTINILNFVPNKLDEVLIRNVLDRKTVLTKFLQEFKKVALDKCVAGLEQYL